MKTLTEKVTFKAGDFCDSCGTSQGYGIARAQVRVGLTYKEDGQDKPGHLLFCNHCYNKMEPRLLALAISVERQEGESHEHPTATTGR